jgi:hypothetical protein
MVDINNAIEIIDFISLPHEFASEETSFEELFSAHKHPINTKDDFDTLLTCYIERCRLCIICSQYIIDGSSLEGNWFCDSPCYVIMI